MDLNTIVIVIVCLLSALILLLCISAYVCLDLLYQFCLDFRYVRNVLCGIKDSKEEG